MLQRVAAGGGCWLCVLQLVAVVGVVVVVSYPTASVCCCWLVDFLSIANFWARLSFF